MKYERTSRLVTREYIVDEKPSTDTYIQHSYWIPVKHIIGIVMKIIVDFVTIYLKFREHCKSFQIPNCVSQSVSAILFPHVDFEFLLTSIW